MTAPAMDPHTPTGARPTLESLWRVHGDTVYRYLARRVPARDLEEAVAGTLTAARARIGEIPSAGLPWLLGVARGVAANVVRSAHLRLAQPDDSPVPPPSHGQVDDAS